MKLHKIDAPGGGPGWDGSLNEPWIGEKGMLTEGGIRVPFIARWPARLPKGKVYSRPVITFDATATALAAAGLKHDGNLDGVDLVPFLNGQSRGDPHDALYWRWVGQSAIREGDWKYLQGANRGYLFDLSSDLHEKKNLITKHPERAAKLRKKLQTWSQELMDQGPANGLSRGIDRLFGHYLDGKLVKRPVRNFDTLFKRRDLNRDGFLTLKEFIGLPKGRNVSALTRIFKRKDTNKDSKLTLKELKEQ